MSKKIVYQIVIAFAIVVVGGTLLAAVETDAQSGQSVIAAHSGKCLDIRGASTTKRAPAQQYTCKGSSNQLWQLVSLGNGTYSMTVSHSGQCLDARKHFKNDGYAVVQQFPCNPKKSNQQWQLVSLGNGYYNIVSRATGLCLDVKGGSTSDRAPVQQYPCKGSANQQWLFQ